MEEREAGGLDRAVTRCWTARVRDLRGAETFLKSSTSVARILEVMASAVCEMRDSRGGGSGAAGGAGDGDGDGGGMSTSCISGSLPRSSFGVGGGVSYMLRGGWFLS